VVTDPDELARLAHAMEAENLEFRRFVKARHGAAELLHVIGSEVEAAMDCTTCAACCRELRVEVGQGDIDRIAAFLKVRPAEIRRMYTAREPSGDAFLTQPAGACVFLHQSVCLIYEVRPEACRLFPYLTPHASSLGSRAASVWRRAWFCPIVFESLEELKRRTGFHPHAGR
jgi:Fe-S-cluster containining protein